MKDQVRETLTRRDQEAAALAASLPADREQLLDLGRAFVTVFNATMLAGNRAAAADASNHYSAVVWKLNGGTFFACAAGDDAPARVLAARCAARAGAVPTWGQTGALIVEAYGVRACAHVSAGCHTSLFSCHLEFCAIDLGRPFPSETGYLSDFPQVFDIGRPFADVVRDIFAEHVRSRERCLIAPEYRAHLEETRPAWLDATPTTAAAADYVEPQGQHAFAF